MRSLVRAEGLILSHWQKKKCVKIGFISHISRCIEKTRPGVTKRRGRKRGGSQQKLQAIPVFLGNGDYYFTQTDAVGSRLGNERPVHDIGPVRADEVPAQDEFPL